MAGEERVGSGKKVEYSSRIKKAEVTKNGQSLCILSD